MTDELIVARKRDIEAMIQGSVREAYAHAHREMSQEIKAMRAALKSARGILTREDVADILGCAPESVWRHHAKGLNFSKPGQKAVYLLDDVLGYLDKARSSESCRSEIGSAVIDE